MSNTCHFCSGRLREETLSEALGGVVFAIPATVINVIKTKGMTFFTKTAARNGQILKCENCGRKFLMCPYCEKWTQYYYINRWDIMKCTHCGSKFSSD